MPACGAVKGLGEVAAHVKAAAMQIAEEFNICRIGGRASTGHINGSDHYTGLAIDCMVLQDKAKGDAVAAYAIAHKAAWNVKYVIWYRRIWQDGNWTHYVGTSPHTDHVHISFNGTPGTGGTSAATSDNAGCVGQFLELLKKATP